VLYGPHGPGAVLGGPESNRVVTGSPDGLPARPKHGTACASGRPGLVFCRARVGPNRAMLVHGPFNASQIF
jgi:hypothetical protein